MNFSYYIAKRYLFTKTSNNAINIITIIASFGVIVSSLALFIILSGFSGLRTFSYSLLDASDPDLKITSVKGKSFLLDDDFLQVLDDNPNITTYAKVIEERVFLEYGDKNEVAFVKGVDTNYANVTKIDDAIYIGDWLDTTYTNTAVIGRAIAIKLSLGVNSYGRPLTVMIPKPGKGFINPNNAFYKMDVQVLGLYTGTEEFENKFVYVTLNQAKELLKYQENQVTALELKITNISASDAVAEELQQTLGDTYKVQTKEQLNEVFYKVINTENFVSYLIFTLIIIIALFNVIGAIIMMIIDKKQNLQTLYNLGTTIQEIKKIFVYQGFLLTFFGMLVGLVLGVILVFLQDAFGLFMITENLAYPVEFQFYNLIIVIFTITVLGFVAAKIASSRINQKFIEK
ncbi:ABC transporter permease [Polaribacter dokdonensis]|uniref:ABC transporter, permease protein n=1 Tax=Polaribacter dokdonensis DSW-5 TaxID=1300348 RepID=A0A0M9CF33_9FLAO|nr:FtsX-like permease family protein [Polaribacter dokdonensis]KOY51232.1 ABC transporter, permease protein [Polaribacter dokdonensis DSW-5]SEE15902.1 lipoprotein-releasing system permease protein [Polaribacter dokdonensis DSW-5]